jgi:hypothetical protein
MRSLSVVQKRNNRMTYEELELGADVGHGQGKVVDVVTTSVFVAHMVVVEHLLQGRVLVPVIVERGTHLIKHFCEKSRASRVR